MTIYTKSFFITPGASSLLIAEAFGIGEGWEKQVVSVNIPDTMPSITLITGESGAGKSTLLRMLSPDLSAQVIPSTPLHLWHPDEVRALALLNSVGLNDAALFVLRFDQLSDSQQARARMYLALCSNTPVLIFDEFLSTLDRKTAAAMAYSFAKAIRREGRVLVAATAHADIIPYLQPELVISGKAFPSRWTVQQQNNEFCNPFQFIVRETDKEEYRNSALGELHYKGKYTGGKQQYLCAELAGEIVGWLVGKLVPGTKQHRIARLVVHPTYRSCGIGQTLVKQYLALQPACDTVAAMARFNPVFERAGMRRVKDVVFSPPMALTQAVPLSPLDWASYEKCYALCQSEAIRAIVAPFATTQHINPGGSLNGATNRKELLTAMVLQSAEKAAAVLWGLRPRTMAKFVGPEYIK